VEAGVGKHGIPVNVHKAAIKPNQSWIVTTTAAGVRPIHQWDLDEAESIDEIIETISLSIVEAGSVFVLQTAREIELTDDYPWARDGVGN
jgi:hypothetical protein